MVWASSLWLAAAGSAAAQQQVKPYFLIVFDTSGSMADAVTDGNGPVEDSCGFGTEKIDHAKCVLNKLLAATGDAEFGLMQFAKANPTSTSGMCGGVSGASCGPTADAGWLRVPIQTNSVQDILPLMDNQPANFGPANELCDGGYTPLGGTLIAARDYFQGDLLDFDAPTAADAALDCRPLSVIMMTDGVECCNGCQDSWSGCPDAAATHAELMSGGDPGPCAATCGTRGGCDSGDQFENAPEQAYGLARNTQVPSASGAVMKSIRTYVIGFGIPKGDPRIERIAIAGETDSPDANTRAFYATDEDSLAVAFNQIIADAQPPSEVCNDADDDCDTLIDEGIPKFCDKPNGVDTPSLCEEPDETLCDGEDDDCDGLVDEGVLNACGVCGEVPPEICDGMDNDCDSRVDEQTSSDEMCGTDEGICMSGRLQCIGGVEVCRGEVGPDEETCNCQDDDCDGFVDEDVDNSLCDDGVCVGCECVPRCGLTAEFDRSCPGGRTPVVQDNGVCVCIIDDCDAPACIASTIERDGEVACAPDHETVGSCVCRTGACVARCDGVGCADGEVCDARTGRCVEDNCRGLGCDEGELCDPLEGECVQDECAEADCAADEVCRGGECERSCAGRSCDSGLCRGGECVDDPCAGVRCDAGELCLPDGECGENPCAGMSCPGGQVCALDSGECERDPCWNVVCPSGQRCRQGECTIAGMTPPRAPSAGEGGEAADPTRVLAAGGGGCSCRVSAGPSLSGRGGLLFGLLLAGVFAWRRRLRAPLLALLAVAAGLWLGGCQVEPFCLDCATGDAAPLQPGELDGGGWDGDGDGGGDGGAPDAGDGGGDAGRDAAMMDAAPPMCEPEEETCNGRDDDCDSNVDEDVRSDVNDCEQLGVCEGTEPTCINGEFACRYGDEREDSESVCDGADNDCDGRIDESFPMLGTDCQVGRGACQVTGELVCNEAGNGLVCEVNQTSEPAEEVCDGVDNDCDGLIDEPRSEPGDEPSFVQDSVVQVGENLWIYAYEASRPDATDGAQGVIGARACSRGGVLPWTNLTFDEAVAACMAADMALCSENQWRNACQTDQIPACAFGYTPPGGGGCLTDESAYPTDGEACNGHDLGAQPGDPDTDALKPTGAMEQCFVDAGNGPVYDLSGNAKEWTTRAGSSPGANPLLGGSYNNLPAGMTCDFDFSLAAPGVRLRNVGFRCCSTAAP